MSECLLLLKSRWKVVLECFSRYAGWCVSRKIWRSASKHLIRAAWLAEGAFWKSSGYSTRSHLPKSPYKVFGKRNSEFGRWLAIQSLKQHWEFFCNLRRQFRNLFFFTIYWHVIERICTAAHWHSAPRWPSVGLSSDFWLPAQHIVCKDMPVQCRNKSRSPSEVIQVCNVSGSSAIFPLEFEKNKTNLKL